MLSVPLSFFLIRSPFARTGKWCNPLFDKCTYVRLSFSLFLCLSLPVTLYLFPISYFLAHLPASSNHMLSFISAIHLFAHHTFLERIVFLFFFSYLIFSSLKSPFLLGCAHRSMSLLIHCRSKVSWSSVTRIFYTYIECVRVISHYSFTCTFPHRDHRMNVYTERGIKKI